ncbi:MAG TPA: DDE-type integrase/transposase/recombinase [Casimicrobiaceae bacterium]
MDEITPKDHAEAVALYRAQIIGAVTVRELDRGELQAALVELSQRRFRAPRSHSSRTYSVATLERWYYAYKEGGLEALRPQARTDKGRGRDLTSAQRELLVAIRTEHPTASVSLILRTLVAEGRLQTGAVSESTVRRFYQERGLDRRTLGAGDGGKMRLRWQADRPMALWHGDVCHGSPLVSCEDSTPVRVHALLDDASRYVLAIEAMSQEREVDMLALLVRAVRRHGPPDALYLDNGSTYRGQTLALACARMGTTLLHAKPYDAPARGKMERFWRTLREGCLDHAGRLASLHDLNVRIWAWLDTHYHKAPHGGLMGDTPSTVFESAARVADSFDEARLRAALTVHARRRVRRDSTLSMDGDDWETDLHFLAGRLVTVSRCMVDPEDPPYIEHEGKRFPLHMVDPVANARRPRSASSHDAPHEARVPFDPARALLDKQLGRGPRATPEADQ